MEEREHFIYLNNPYYQLGNRKRESFLINCGVIRGILFAVCRKRFIDIIQAGNCEYAIIRVKCTDEQYEEAKAIIRDEFPDDYMDTNFDWKYSPYCSF